MGLWQLLQDLGTRLLDVSDEEFADPRVKRARGPTWRVIVAEGNPRIAETMAAAGCEVHAYAAWRSV